jgi:hypothetical protein
LSDNDGSDSDDNESLDTEDLEWMAELERYDEIQARAREIIERQYQEAMEDNDIEVDSDGQDEMGGIGIGSDGQDEMEGIGIGSDGQDEMEGIEIEGIGGHSGDSEVLGLAFSPRKTRSGRVVRYIHGK